MSTIETLKSRFVDDALTGLAMIAAIAYDLVIFIR